MQHITTDLSGSSIHIPQYNSNEFIEHCVNTELSRSAIRIPQYSNIQFASMLKEGVESKAQEKAKIEEQSLAKKLQEAKDSAWTRIREELYVAQTEEQVLKVVGRLLYYLSYLSNTSREDVHDLPKFCSLVDKTKIRPELIQCWNDYILSIGSKPAEHSEQILWGLWTFKIE